MIIFFSYLTIRLARTNSYNLLKLYFSVNKEITGMLISHLSEHVSKLK